LLTLKNYQGVEIMLVADFLGLISEK